MKKIYATITLLTALAYIGCGSIEVSSDKRVLKSTSEYDRGSFRTSQIELIKNYTLEGTAVDIALSKDKNVAYIASGEGGLEIVDISNPYAPKYIDSVDLVEYANYVKVIDDRVYVGYITENTRPYMDLKVFDINNPYYPKYIGTNQNRSTVAHYRAKRGDILVETNDEGVAIYRANGDHYSLSGEYSLGDHAYAVALKGNYILVANGRDGLTILRSDIGGNSGRFIK